MKKLNILSPYQKYDWPLLVTSILLAVISLSVIYSTTLAVGSDRLFKQSVALILGLVIVAVFSLIDYRRWGSWAWYLYSASLIVLSAVLAVGSNFRGTRGWFELGGLTFQPVELVKVVMVVILARYFSLHTNHNWKDWPKTLLIICPLLILLILQPDFGPVFIILIIWLLLNALRGLTPKGWLILIGAALLVSLIAWFSLLSAGQKDRLKIFVNPSLDPTGRGFQVRQSIIAIGSGSLTGAGLGQGVQSQLQFLPEAPTDFIFAALLEQLGLVGFLMLLSLWLVMYWRIFKLVKSAREDFTLYLTLGLGLLLFVQTAINVAMNLGLAPIVGLPLPFLSYGGSALLSAFLIVGLLESIAIRQSSV